MEKTNYNLKERLGGEKFLRRGVVKWEKVKVTFAQMFQELHEVLHPEGWSLTAALGAGKDTMEAGYDLQELNKYLDHVHLMCYDYHGKWDNQTGANAPLHSADPLDVNTVVCNHRFYSNSGL